jgi:hypothetical protein
MLFRSVNRTMYAEDLASTNGMKVNGLATQHQVVHHLDMIEVGTHRLHFFDEDLLGPKGLDSLEDTVHTDYERTMMAHEAPGASPAPAPPEPAREDFSRTMAIERDPTLRLGPRGSAVAQEVQPLALRVVAGDRSGETIDLKQANTILGIIGGDSALVVRRNNGYFVVRFGGNRPPRVNDREVGSGSVQLSPHDRIEVGHQRYEVIPAAP